MIADPEEFRRARALLERGLLEAYAEAPEAPIEEAEGSWLLWPDRAVRASVEETRRWTYGVPGEPTGGLQYFVDGPAGMDARIRPRLASAPLGEREARRAVEEAVAISRTAAWRLSLDRPDGLFAWKLGHETFGRLPPSGKDRFLDLRQAAVRSRNWTPFNAALDIAVTDLGAGEGFRLARIDRGYDLFYRGFTAGIDDWSGPRFYGHAGGDYPFGVLEWRPRR